VYSLSRIIDVKLSDRPPHRCAAPRVCARLSVYACTCVPWVTEPHMWCAWSSFVVVTEDDVWHLGAPSAATMAIWVNNLRYFSGCVSL
jgi:hypothetical protein